jgi:hypothetical protein
VVERLKALCETSFGTLRTLLPDCRRHVNSRCPVSEQVDQLVAWAEGGGPGLDEVVRVAAEEWPQLFQTESAPAQLRAPVRNGKP